MDKIAIKVTGAPSFFEEVANEAARLDRSPSWLLGQCLRVSLAALAATTAPPPKLGPKPTSAARTFYVPRELCERFDRLGRRYGCSRDDLFDWAWQTTRDAVKRIPTS